MNDLQHLLRKLRYPAYLVMDRYELFYVTGELVDGYWLLLTKNGVVAFAHEMIAMQLENSISGLKIVRTTSLVKSVAEYVKKHRLNSVSVDPAKISHSLFRNINSKINLKSVESPINDSRLIKTDNELKNIEKACRIASKVIKKIKMYLKPGKSEIEIAFKIEEYFAENHVEPAFQTIVASGPNAANPHHVPSSRKLKQNEAIVIDMGCKVGGYCSDLTRTYFLGKIPVPVQRTFAAVLAAQKTAIKAVKKGVRACRIDKAARDVLKTKGLDRFFIHTTGHGVGLEVHEKPRLSMQDKTVLKKNMVVTVEPGGYISGSHGVRIEDTVVVTNNGCRILTKGC